MVRNAPWESISTDGKAAAQMKTVWIEVYLDSGSLIGFSREAIEPFVGGDQRELFLDIRLG